MSFDGLFLHHMTEELVKNLEGGRIQKVSQPFKDEVILSVRANGRSQKLLISAHPIFGRIQLTQTDLPNPKVASTFVMVLRKYLAGALIQKINQIENDRLLWLHISSKDEIGDTMKIALIIEIMGKHSNIILVDLASHKILESIKHIGFSQNQYRTILPGSDYLSPPQSHQLNPFTASDEQIFTHLQTQEKFEGLARDSWQALVGLTLPEFKSRLTTPVPSVYPSDTFSSIRLSDNFEVYPSLSTMLDSYYKGKADRDRVKQVAASLVKKVQNELKKNKEKLKKQKRELADTDQAEIYRQKGELLTTYIHQVPNNQNQVTLDNYYTDQPLNIALDPAYSPSQNAQRYFHKYQKLKQAVKFLDQQIQQTKQTIAYLESVEVTLTNADISELADIKEELVQTGFFKKRSRDKTHRPLPPDKYQAPDGSIILVGKNNLQNEQVSFKLAKKGDLWFHVKDLPGSHVLITGNSKPDDETITFAGELAAYFSKARYSNLVQVDVLEAKKLHKPTGTPPGFVTYNREKTIRVKPDVEVIRTRKIPKKTQ